MAYLRGIQDGMRTVLERWELFRSFPFGDARRECTAQVMSYANNENYQPREDRLPPILAYRGINWMEFRCPRPDGRHTASPRRRSPLSEDVESYDSQEYRSPTLSECQRQWVLDEASWSQHRKRHRQFCLDRHLHYRKMNFDTSSSRRRTPSMRVKRGQAAKDLGVKPRPVSR